MEYRILRDEKKDGERFVQVEIDDGAEVYTRAEWLTDSDYTKAENDGIDSVAIKIAQRAVKARPAERLREERQYALEIAKLEADAAAAKLEAEKLKA